MAERAGQWRLWLPWGMTFLRLNVAAIFLVAGLSKVWRPGAFLVAMNGFKLLDESVLVASGLMLIWMEICCGFLMLLGLRVRAAAVLLMVMLAVFLVAVASAILRGLDIDCGCFGAFMRTGIGWYTLLRVLALMVVTALLLRHGGGRFALDSLIGERRA